MRSLLLAAVLAIAAPVQAQQFYSCAKDGAVHRIDVGAIPPTAGLVGKLLRPGTSTVIGTAACDLEAWSGRLYFFEGPTNKKRFGYWEPGGTNGVTTIVATYSSAQHYMKRMSCPAGETWCWLMDDGGTAHHHVLYKISKATGTLTAIGTVSGVQLPQWSAVTGMGDDAISGGVHYLTNVQTLFTLDEPAMAATVLFDDMLLPEAYVFTGLASCGGALYVSLGQDEGGISRIRRLDLLTGTVEQLGLEDLPFSINDLASCAVP